ncbi:MAG TPA: hypothetical protein VFD29_08005 [Gillisia sp.]|nr:hypothetical protein [Gillisia sp.]
MKKNKLANQTRSGFKVPKNYFEDFEAKMTRAISADKTFGDQYKGNPGFTIPENYFDSLENQVLAKVERPEPRGMVISLFRKKKLYAAAGIAAVFIGIISTLLFKPNPINLLDSEKISVLEEYIDQESIDLNFNEITTFLYEEGYVLDDLDTSDLSDEAVFDYLNEHVEDPALILY